MISSFHVKPLPLGRGEPVQAEIISVYGSLALAVHTRNTQLLCCRRRLVKLEDADVAGLPLRIPDDGDQHDFGTEGKDDTDLGSSRAATKSGS